MRLVDRILDVFGWRTFVHASIQRRSNRAKSYLLLLFISVIWKWLKNILLEINIHANTLFSFKIIWRKVTNVLSTRKKKFNFKLMGTLLNHCKEIKVVFATVFLVFRNYSYFFSFSNLRVATYKNNLHRCLVNFISGFSLKT